MVPKIFGLLHEFLSCRFVCFLLLVSACCGNALGQAQQKGDCHKLSSRCDIGDYTKLLEENPKDPIALLNRGLAYLNAHQFDSAIADFDLVILIDPHTRSVYSWRGTAKSDIKQWDSAIVDYGRPEFVLAGWKPRL